MQSPPMGNMFSMGFACCRGHGGLVNDFLSWSGWGPIAKISFMTYLVHMDIMYIYFAMQDYNLDWTMLPNVKLFLGNLTAALTLGLVTSIAWELPFAKLQKILIQGAVRAASGR